VKELRDAGYDIRWIRTESPGISDPDVMRFAYREKRVILTCDKDFGELAVKETAYPSAGIILVRVFRQSPSAVAEYIRNILRSREDREGNFSVIEQDRIRMRPLRHDS
jgi:predicted nuclease of predicted toxin-antitoxin system